MRILSYRGPSAPGGVASAVTQIFEEEQQSCEWWFVSGDRLCRKSSLAESAEYGLDFELIERHYRYCNNFLWPVLHDLPQFAHYSEEDRRSYKSFNSSIAFRLRNFGKWYQTGCFVNDYQFALIPGLLIDTAECFVFWHIPWPEQIGLNHAGPLEELAVGLLQAKVVGFHTDEYMANFFDFVARYMPQCCIDYNECTVSHEDKLTKTNQVTRFVTAPLGIDTDYWSDLARSGRAQQQDLVPSDIPVILSIDRVDYTKGIVERFKAIDHFFRCYPQWQGKVSFIQLATRSRKGLPEFDRYWNECRERCIALNRYRPVDGWQPLIWTDSPRIGTELANLYSRASVMLVSPVRDGLNLTAKEYIACQGSHPGVLGLSRGAGVWKELGRDCVEVEPLHPESFAYSIARCLEMADAEKLRRIKSMQVSLRRNTLALWWQSFQNTCRMARSRDVLDNRVGSQAERICS